MFRATVKGTEAHSAELSSRVGWGAPWAGLRHFWELCSLSCFPLEPLAFYYPRLLMSLCPSWGQDETDTSRRVGSQHLGRGIMTLCRPALHPSPWPTGWLAGTWAEAPGSPPPLHLPLCHLVRGQLAQHRTGCSRGPFSS